MPPFEFFPPKNPKSYSSVKIHVLSFNMEEGDMNFQNFSHVLCSTHVSSEDEGENSFVFRITLEEKGEKYKNTSFRRKENCCNNLK